jgi:GMP synthase (glutamine-hydrolysing)
MTISQVHDSFDTVLILDFGSQVRLLNVIRLLKLLDHFTQYSHLITRRCRELNVYAELLPCTQKVNELDWKPKGIPPAIRPCNCLSLLNRNYTFWLALLRVR